MHLRPLDQDQLVIADPILHNLLRIPQIRAREPFLPVVPECRQRRNQRGPRRPRDPPEVLLLAPADGHGSGADELFQAEVVDAFGREDDVGAGFEDQPDPFEHDLGFAVRKDRRSASARWMLQRGRAHRLRMASSCSGSSMVMCTPRCILCFCKFMSKHAIFAPVIFFFIAVRKNPPHQQACPAGDAMTSERTLTRDRAVQSVALDELRLQSASAVRFEDVDGFDGVLDFATGVDGLDGEHGVDRESAEEVVVPVRWKHLPN